MKRFLLLASLLALALPAFAAEPAGAWIPLFDGKSLGYTMTITVEGKRIVTKVNGAVIVDYTEEESVKGPGQLKGRFLSNGTFAIQGHDPGSEVHFKNIAVRPLP